MSSQINHRRSPKSKRHSHPCGREAAGCSCGPDPRGERRKAVERAEQTLMDLDVFDALATPEFDDSMVDWDWDGRIIWDEWLQSRFSIGLFAPVSRPTPQEK